MPKTKPKIPMIFLLEAMALTSKRSLACLYTTSYGKSKEKSSLLFSVGWVNSLDGMALDGRDVKKRA
jgi:hypothetical protein